MKEHTCPHCGRTISSKGKRHIHTCIGNPTVYAATKAALDDGTGQIKRKDTYLAECPPGATSATTLSQQLGAWEQVAAHFGLRHVGVKRGPHPHQPQRVRTDWDAIVAAMTEELHMAAAVVAANLHISEGLPVSRQRVEGSTVYSILR